MRNEQKASTPWTRQNRWSGVLVSRYWCGRN